MPYNGSGTFSRVHDFEADRDAAINIKADRMDAEFDGIATALSLCILKDGQQDPTSDLPMNTKKHTNVGDAALHNQYPSVKQVHRGMLTTLGSVSTSGKAITASGQVPFAALTTGMQVRMKMDATPTSSPATLDIDGLGATNVSGVLRSGKWYDLLYNGTNFKAIEFEDRDFTDIVNASGPFTEADGFKMRSVDLSSTPQPVLPLPGDVPNGWWIILHLNSRSTASFRQNFVQISARTTESFGSFGYPFYTPGGGEIARFISDGSSIYYVEILQDTQDFIYAKMNWSAAFSTAGAWACPSTDSNAQNITNFYGLTSGLHNIQVPVTGRYYVCATGLLANHAGFGASASNYGYIDIGSNSARENIGADVAGYGALAASMPSVKAAAVVHRASAEYCSLWANIAATGRFLINSGNGGLFVSYVGR